MNVRDPFNIRNLNRGGPIPIATWSPRKAPSNAPNEGFTALQHIIRTAATATQSAAADLREKAGEVVASAQQVLSEAAATASNTLDDDGDSDGGDHHTEEESQEKRRLPDEEAPPVKHQLQPQTKREQDTTCASKEPKPEGRKEQSHGAQAPLAQHRHRQQLQQQQQLKKSRYKPPPSTKIKEEGTTTTKNTPPGKPNRQQQDDGGPMSFAVPQNVPSFSAPQRRLEDQLWAASSSSRQRYSTTTTTTNNNNNSNIIGGRGSVLSNIQGGVQNLLSPNRGRGDGALPMYKDKPSYYYPPGGRGYGMMTMPGRGPRRWRRKRTGLLLVLVVLGLLWWTGWFGGEDGEDEGGLMVGGQGNSRLSFSEWLSQDVAGTGLGAAEGDGGGGGSEGGKKGKKGGKKGKGGGVDWLERRQRVVEAMELSWDAYERYAWGYDEFRPESKKGNQMAPKGLGWIIIDSLDTLMLMNLTSRVAHAREWLSKELTWDQDQDVNMFETTIRMLGGLLSAHYLSTEYPHLAPIEDDDPGAPGEDLYLEKAKDLADRLMAGFDSPSGVPYASVNLGKFQGITSHTDAGASSTAETTTLQLEFKYLAKLTGEKEFWDKAEKVMQVVDDNGAQDGLVPIYISATTGKFQGQNIRLGSRGDSYYEYLIKQYLQTNKKEPIYQEMWREAMQGVRKHLITYTKHSQFTIIGERPSGLSGELSPKVDHLVCFMPGTIALAATGGLTEKEAKKLPTWTEQDEADMQLARELMQTCWGMYKFMATGLAAEITHFAVDNPPPPESAPHQAPADFDPSPDAEWRKDFIVKPQDAHNLQRPETVESLFYMWRITGDARYREWGWDMFRSFVNHTAVAGGSGGFTSLSNADTVPPVSRDNMESFWLAETLKYFYLLFSPDDLLPLDGIVLNTEAHVFPRFDMAPLFETGWKRKPRDAEGRIVVEE
ncbi:hypothetical protein VTK26DRAFT_3123 [Humicola hyalothermophila]